MSVVASFRPLYLVSRVFGLFPYEPNTSKGFRVQKSVLRRGRCVFGVMFIVRIIIFSLDVKYNLYSTGRRVMTIFRAGNNVWLHILMMFTYSNIIMYSKSTCGWLNKITKLYICLKGNQNIISIQFLCYYSIIFFLGTNTLALIGFLINKKFLNGWIAFSDGFGFVFLLMVQNLHFCQFLSYMCLMGLSFQRINEILQGEEIKREKGESLLKKLKLSRRQHLEVTDFFDFINDTFQLNVLLYIIWAFISTLFCTISLVLFDIEDAITLVLWMSYHPFQNFPIIYLCERTYAESRKSISYLGNDFLIHNADPEIKEEVEIFSLQLQHRPTVFSVCGFFQLNFGLIGAAIGVATTYIIALIQIQPSYIPANATSYDT